MKYSKNALLSTFLFVGHVLSLDWNQFEERNDVTLYIPSLFFTGVWYTANEYYTIFMSDNGVQQKKIIVAEDEKPLALAMQLKLKKEGVEADVVGNGEELLSHLNSNHYDLIVMDLVMPKMDGFKVLESLQQSGNTTPIIVTSNLSQEEDKQKAIELGAQAYLIKSNTHIAEIINQIKAALSIWASSISIMGRYS